jgi:O-antigen/teichoic acid export membrane protein
MKAAAGQITFALLAFGGAVLSARLLGPSGKGALAAWMLLATLAPVLLAGSVPVGLGRAYLSGRRDQVVRSMVRHGLVTAAGCSAASVIAGVAGVDPLGLVIFVVVCIPFGVIYLDFYMVAQAAKLPWLYHAGRIAGGAVYTLGLTVIAVLHVSRPQHLIWMIYAAGIAGSTVAVLIVCGRRFGAAPGLGLREASDKGRRSLWLLALDLIVLRLDQYVVLSIVGTGGLGVYGVAVNWSEITKYFGDAFGQAVFEDEATLDNASARRILRRVTTSLTGISVLVALSGFLLIPYVFGQGFAGARWAVLLLAPGLVARGAFHVASSILLGRGRAADAARITGIVAVGAVVVWIITTALFGINGTAFASSAVYFAQAVMIFGALMGPRTPSSSAPGIRYVNVSGGPGRLVWNGAADSLGGIGVRIWISGPSAGRAGSESGGRAG